LRLSCLLGLLASGCHIFASGDIATTCEDLERGCSPDETEETGGLPTPPTSTTSTSAIDADGDGATTQTDCDDANGAIHPGAAEVCDGLDNDCDGTVDVDATDAADRYLDEDGDSFGDQLVRACPDESGTAESGGDCDDSDASIHPEAEEVCDDGVDNDCDGGAGDCPSLPRELLRTDADVFISDGDVGEFGQWISAGDVTGDGATDLLVSATTVGGGSGAIRVYSGAELDGELNATRDAAAAILGSLGGGFSARVAATPDLTGDGYADIIATSSGEGTIYLVPGPVSGASTAADVAIRVTGMVAPEGASGIGSSLSAGDFTGDGAADLLIGDPFAVAQSDATFQGMAWVVVGPLSADPTGNGIDLSTLKTAAISGNGSALTGEVVTDVGDTDGDGVHDVLVTAPGDSACYGASAGGAAYLFTQPTTGMTISVDEADSITCSSHEQGQLGYGADGGDINGDGLSDFIVSAPLDEEEGGGAAYVLTSPVHDFEHAQDATLSLIGGEDPYFASSVSLGGDLDGDGGADIVIGHLGLGTAQTGLSVGGVRIFIDPGTGVLSIDDADTVIYGSSMDSPQARNYGLGVLGVDLNEDGFGDVAASGLGLDGVDLFLGGSGL